MSTGRKLRNQTEASIGDCMGHCSMKKNPSNIGHTSLQDVTMPDTPNHRHQLNTIERTLKSTNYAEQRC
jgi:hypothetical protein